MNSSPPSLRTLGKRLLLLSFLFVAHFAMAQIEDDFSDGEFTNNPTWVSSNESGLGSDFQVSGGELQSTGPAASATIYITTLGLPSLENNNLSWQFNVRYENAPSSSNRIEIFLLSDKENLNDAPQGYFIRIGESGSEDGIDLFKTNETNPIISDPNPSVGSNVNATIRVTRDDLGNWVLSADNTGGTNFVNIGSANDTEFLSGGYFGFKVAHTSTRNQSYFFDNVSISAQNTDTSPPNILTVTPALPDQILITYDEAVEITSAENVANYNLNNGYGSPISAELINNNEVRLTFGSDLISGDYAIHVSNVSDLNGNILTNEQASFNVFIPDQAEFREVIITEIMADPSPVVGLPESDFIEVYNGSDKTFDLAGWSIADSNNETILTSYILQPDSYLILCANSRVSEFEQFGNALGVSSFQNFNNAGDEVVLKNETNELIDYVNYSDDWYRLENFEGGISLELIDPFNVCGGPDNWRASNNTQGGTPGSINSVFENGTDLEPPELLSAVAQNSTELLLTFSEELDTLSVQLSGFSLDPQIPISDLSIDQNQVSLSFSTSLETSTSYSISVNNINDCTGNSITAQSLTFQYVSNPALSFKDVIISEIMANPNIETSSPDAEYLELYNNTTSELNLVDWTISDLSTTASLPLYILEGGEYVILTSEGNLSLFANMNVIGLVGFPSLNNSGDNITLRNENAELIDSVNYASSWYRSSIKDDGGFSLEIIDPTDPCSDENNWIACEDDSGGTPGRINSVLSIIPDNIGPSLDAAFGISEDTVMLIFSERLDKLSALSAEYELSSGLEISSISIVNDQVIYILLNESTPLITGENYEVQVNNITDCPGNIIGSNNTASFNLIEQAELGDVLLNEILFNPIVNGSDFVEIVNTSNKFISLQGWKLANGSFENDSLRLNTVRVITEEPLIMSPGTYLAISNDIQNVLSTYPNSISETLYNTSSLPAFPDEEGVVVILSEANDTLDFFVYSEDFHSKVIDNNEGVSLERISLSTPTDNSENWISAAANENFATPGYVNSQSKTSTTLQSGEIQIEPQVIVPDGDGVDDFAQISYAFNQSGFVATVNVYDVTGRLVKQIAVNDLISQTGFYTWDGTSDRGDIVKIGYYIVLFQAFHPNGKTQELKKKVAVGTRF